MARSGFLAQEGLGALRDIGAVGRQGQAQILADQMGEQLADHGVVLDQDDAGFLFR